MGPPYEGSTVRELPYAPFRRSGSPYLSLCYTSFGEQELAQWVHHASSIRRFAIPTADAVPLNYVLLTKHALSTHLGNIFFFFIFFFPHTGVLEP